MWSYCLQWLFMLIKLIISLKSLVCSLNRETSNNFVCKSGEVGNIVIFMVVWVSKATLAFPTRTGGVFKDPRVFPSEVVMC